MTSLEELTDLLNTEATEEFMMAIMELWNNGDNPFDPEHPSIEPILQNIVDTLNEKENSTHDTYESDY